MPGDRVLMNSRNDEDDNENTTITLVERINETSLSCVESLTSTK